MTLQPIEVDALTEHEATIANGLQTFKEVGCALADIRDRRLYRGDYGTFEDYCRERWNLSRTHADRMITASQVAKEMAPIGVISTESQARAIAPVLRDHGPEVAAEVLREAADDDGRLTARSISEAATRVIEPEIVEAEVIDDERPVLTSQQWMAREGYADELAPRRRTEAEREALRAKSKSDAIRQRNLDVNVGFSVISELKHPHILDEVLDNWQPLSTDWTAPMIHDLADLLHQIADRWKATA